MVDLFRCAAVRRRLMATGGSSDIQRGAGFCQFAGFCFGEILGPAVRAVPWHGGIVGRAAAAWAEADVGRQVLAAVGTPAEDHLLVAAKRTKARPGRDLLSAVRTTRHRRPGGQGRLRSRLTAVLEQPGEHGRQHQSDARPHGLAGGSGGVGRLFHRHGRLHPGQPVQIRQGAEAAAVVDGLLDLGRRGDGVEVQVSQGHSKVGQVGLEPLGQGFGELVVAGRQVENRIDGVARGIEPFEVLQKDKVVAAHGAPPFAQIVAKLDAVIGNRFLKVKPRRALNCCGFTCTKALKGGKKQSMGKAPAKIQVARIGVIV